MSPTSPAARVSCNGGDGLLCGVELELRQARSLPPPRSGKEPLVAPSSVILPGQNWQEKLWRDPFPGLLVCGNYVEMGREGEIDGRNKVAGHLGLT